MGDREVERRIAQMQVAQSITPVGIRASSTKMWRA
jgi:hypothetical protein